MIAKLNKWFVIVATLVLALTLALGVGVAYSSTGPAAPQNSYASPGLLTVGDGSVASTGNLTSYARYIAGYSLMDYGGNLVAATGQTVTAKIQVSFNGTTWLDYLIVHNAVGNGTTTITPTQTTAVGVYVRMVYTPVSSTLQYTPTMWLMFK